ncbi:hypothetical protein GCM10028824_27310 [Hymenobacter segetis]|uniref:Lipoprotein n=1 Tax=Hymenobacter segetis TaxID=2025509 RepID=A0ABU9M0R2_9BACT
MRQRFLPILFLTTLLGCSKSDSNPIADFGEGEGITYRTGSNLPAGPSDPTDWTSDGEWNKQERALFTDLNFDLNGPQQSGLVSVSPAYPNPSAGQANWSLNATRPAGGNAASYSVRALLVNRQYKIMRQLGPTDFVNGIQFSIDYIGAGLSPNELYRLYYVVYNATGLVYKGHGDVRYNR